MRNWIVAKKLRCCSFSSVLSYKSVTFLLHRSDSLPSQSPHLIYSSIHPPTRWSALYLFPILPLLVTHLSHSLFLLLQVRLWVKYFYLWSSYCVINSSQQQTGSISLYHTLFLFSSLSSSFSFIPGLFIDQYPYRPSARPKMLEGN